MRADRRLLLALTWLALLAVAGFYVARGLRVSTDLRSFLPPPASAEQRLLMSQIGNGPGSRVLLVAITGADTESAARLSRGLAAALAGDARFSQVVNGDIDPGRLDPALLPYRYLLSPTLDRHRFDAAYLHQQLEQRLADLSSPAGAMLERWLPRDPTLELLKLVQRWTPAHAPGTREGVWFDRRGEALLLLQTRAAGFDPAAQAQAIAAVRAAFMRLPGHAGARLVLTGPGYFSVQVNRHTRAEADAFGAASTLGFVLLLLWAYRSPGAVLLAALPVASGALAGLAALVACYTQVHGITLAFGFTLLGVAQEYPIRLLSHRRAGADAVAGVRALWPLLATAIVSACIAYMAFYASGVPGLRQLAVFTIAGLLAAGLSTRYLLPRVLPVRCRDVADRAWLWRWRSRIERLPRPRGLPLLVSLAVIAGCTLAPGPFWQNDLAALTPLPHKLLATDARLRRALGAPDVRYLLLLRANSAEGVLRLSERIEPQVRQWQRHGAVADVELPSRYLPSARTQRARQQRLPDAASLAAALAQADAGMPFRGGLFAPFLADVAKARRLPALTPEALAHSPWAQRLRAMLLAQPGGGWVGLASVSGLRDAAVVRSLSKATHGQVRLLDLKAASESLIAAYRLRILEALGVAALLLVVTITLALRSLRRAWHVLAPMTLATFAVLAVERLAGIEISLFHLVALILAAGLGLHYALFFERRDADRAEQCRTLHATLVCVASALLVFGLLAFSSIPVLRAIGLTVSLGVAFHFCLSILMAPHAMHSAPVQGHSDA